MAEKNTSKKGRPKVSDAKKKRAHSIRFYEKDEKNLIKRYGTLQKAIDVMLETDNEFWS